MKLYESIKSNRGSVTPFLVLMAILFVSVFFTTYSYYEHIASKAALKGYVQVASDDLLAGFDATLFKDYGVLAYRNINAEEDVIKSVTYNTEANVQESSLIRSINPLSSQDIQYIPLKTLINGDCFVDNGLRVAGYYLPKGMLQELNSIYKWSETYSEKGHAFQQLNELMVMMQEVQTSVREYYEVIETINTLDGHDIEWFGEVDEVKAASQLTYLLRDHRKGIRLLKKIQDQIEEGKHLHRQLEEEIQDPKMRQLLDGVSFGKDVFQHMFSSGDASLDDIIDDLQENASVLEVIISEEAYRGVDVLATDFYIQESTKGDRGWLRFLSGLTGALSLVDNTSGLTVKALACEESILIDETLGLEEKLLFHEYILGVLKSKITVPHRDFAMLNREERGSSIAHGEVEYVVTGAVNSEWIIRAEVFGLRLGGNVTYLLMDKEKFQLCSTIGTAIGGWFPGGSAISTTVVVGAWAGVESIYDLEQLYSGNGVPFMKNDVSWHYDIDIDNKRLVGKSDVIAEGKDGQGTLSYYNDYLRLLLMLVPDEQKINRTLEVVKYNMTVSTGTPFILGEHTRQHHIQWSGNKLIGGYDERSD